jgi:hypothetical protein
VRAQNQSVYDYLLSLHPFPDAANRWLAVLSDLAVQGKHIDLIPQKRTKDRVTTVEEAGVDSVSWGQSRSGPFIGFGPGGRISLGFGGVIGFGPEEVKFGGKIAAMGVPIDPCTQRVVPTPKVTERVEVWISFLMPRRSASKHVRRPAVSQKI